MPGGFNASVFRLPIVSPFLVTQSVKSRAVEASLVPSQLIELGRQALTDVRIGVANGQPLVRCQLLAAEFYEALKRALRAPELSPRNYLASR
jgi:hypothetical protein